MKPTTEYKLVRNLILIVLFFAFFNIISEYLGHPSGQLNRFLNVGFEGNIPTWFSSLLLLIVALYAYICSKNEQDKKAKNIFLILSFGAILMLCDETARIHEDLGTLVKNKLHFNLAGAENSAWVVYLGIPVLIIGLIFAVNFFKNVKKANSARRNIILGGMLFVFGSFLLEYLMSRTLHVSSFSLFIKYEYIAEEMCEMLGVILVILGLIQYNNFLLGKRSILQR